MPKAENKQLKRVMPIIGTGRNSLDCPRAAMWEGKQGSLEKRQHCTVREGSPGPSSDHSSGTSSPLFDSGLHLNGNSTNTGIIVTHMDNLAFGLVEPHTVEKVCPDPSADPSILQQINTATLLGVLCKLTDSDRLLQITNKDFKQDWPKY
ncbi:hypothetical protein DUI87_05921 [Hirundo rustica rustica]|uniref:Uncharacterized protein n=1 Tax=Hirundo rustica rustica TaxID=333673 RepID=A0A3M0L337_HIRRU|nr:hypothetical protein DUI87_05921 [Hirundo rustica rustica]